MNRRCRRRIPRDIRSGVQPQGWKPVDREEIGSPCVKGETVVVSGPPGRERLRDEESKEGGETRQNSDLK